MTIHAKPFLRAIAILLIVCAAGYAFPATQVLQNKNSNILIAQDNGNPMPPPPPPPIV
jgi:hypothetical protein